MTLEVRFLGRVDYPPTFAAMKDFVAQRPSGERAGFDILGKAVDCAWIAEFFDVDAGAAQHPGQQHTVIAQDVQFRIHEQ